MNDADRVDEPTMSRGPRPQTPRALRRGIVALAAIVTLGIAAAPASADWSRPFALTSPAAPFTFGDGPAVQVAPDGSFTTAWLRSRGGPTSKGIIQARHVDANGTLGPVLTLTSHSRNVRYPRLAFAPDGSAIVVWARVVAPQRIALESRRIDANGTLSPVVRVTEPGDRALSKSVAMDSAGNATIAWVNQQNDSSVLKVRRIAANDELGDEQTLTRTLDGRVTEVKTAVGPDRRPLVVYNQFGRIKTQRLSASGEPLPGVVQLSSPDDTASDLSAEADAAGVVRVSWGRLDPNPLQVFTRTVAPDGTLGTTQTVTDQRSVAPAMALNPAGGSSIAWQDTPSSPSGLQSVQASTVLPTGEPGPIFRLSALSEDGGFDPQVGIDSQGASMAVWQRGVGDTTVVEAGRFSAAGPLGNVSTLSRPSDLVPSPNVAVNGDGRALAVWWQGTPKSDGVVARAALFTPPATDPPSSGSPDIRCHGRRASIVGTPYGDKLIGTPRKDVIVARRGGDTIHGRGGNDVICGNRGTDTLRGGRGHDRLFGGPGRDSKRP